MFDSEKINFISKTVKAISKIFLGDEKFFSFDFLPIKFYLNES